MPGTPKNEDDKNDEDSPTNMLRQLLRKLEQQLNIPDGAPMTNIDEVDVTAKFILDMTSHMHANKIALTEHILDELKSSTGQLTCLTAMASLIIQANAIQRKMAGQLSATKEMPDWLKDAIEGKNIPR